jgi:hypothetical protein
MKILFQALKLGFWALPAQRVCTAAGISVMAFVVLVVAARNLSAETLAWGMLGELLLFLPVLVMGGAVWRAFSAQRAISLAPHGRARLLGAALMMAVFCGLVTATYQWLMYLWLPVKWRMDLLNWWHQLVSTFVFASCWAMASFLAARSALAAFTVLLVLLGAGFTMSRLDLPPLHEILPGGGLSLALVAWIAFGTWYLRIRRIAPSAWSFRRAENEAPVTNVDTGGIGADVSRDAALERLLFGGRSVSRMTLQWLLVMVLLQAMLFGIGHLLGEPERVGPVQFASLVLAIVAVGAPGFVATSRARSLWLVCGSTRAGLFALVERKLLQLAAGIAAVSALFLVALWFGLAWRPEATLGYGVIALVGTMLMAVYVHLPGWFGWRGATVALTVFLLLRTYWEAFVLDEHVSWWWVAAVPVATVALRILARRRWLAEDMPRVANAPAS